MIPQDGVTEKLLEAFDQIKFKDPKNIKLLNRWRIGNSKIVRFFTFFAILTDRDRSAYNTPDYDFQQMYQRDIKRISQLNEIKAILDSQGEEAAGELLRKHYGVLPPIIKVLALLLLTFCVMAFLISIFAMP